MTRILRSDFEQNIARNAIQKPKLFWRYAKFRLKPRQNIPTLEKSDGSKATTPKEKADSLNEFFCSVVRKERLDNILELSEDFPGETAGYILKWIKSFLTGRIQCVSVEGEISNWREVTSGIPRGSVIGPLLFVIFINDIPNEVKHNV